MQKEVISFAESIRRNKVSFSLMIEDGGVDVSKTLCCLPRMTTAIVMVFTYMAYMGYGIIQ